MMRTTMAVLTAVGLGAGAMVIGAAPAAAQADPTDRLREVLGDEVTDFQLVDLDVRSLAAGLADGKGTLPAITDKGELVELTMAAEPARLREEGLDTGILRSRRGAERVPLPAEQAYRLGSCPDGDSCATATILDEQATMVSGLVVAPDVEMSYYEPVNQLLDTDEFPGLHVVYHDAATLDLVIDDETAMIDRDRDIERQDPKDPGELQWGSYVSKATKIVLDADRTFYNANPATVWSRQLAIFNDFSVLYELIEPLSTENPETVRWRLDLTVKGQEAWVSGGPSTTDNSALIAEISAPGYWLIHPVADHELHLFFVGYNVNNVYGQAAGIGSAWGGFGGAPGKNHVFVEALTTQTAKTKWVVSAHEIGHLIGGTHGAGSANSCSTFHLLWWSIPICGVSIMAPGSAGAPDGRASYFTDANDANIGAVIGAVL